MTCLLCPHYCELSSGAVGKCLVRGEKDGEVILSTHSCLSVVAVEPIEKKPFRHYLSNTKTLSLGGYGCNLDCRFCENHRISQESSDPKEKIDPKQIIRMAHDKGCQSICMTYNEPIVYIEYLLELGRLCQKNKLPFLLKTNAFVSPDVWFEICSLNPVLNIDWKGSRDKFKYITNSNAYVVEDRIKEAFETPLHIEISVPLYYDDKDIEEEMRYLGNFLSSLSDSIPCHILTVYPAHNYLDFLPSKKNMSMALDILSSYMMFVYEYK